MHTYLFVVHIRIRRPDFRAAELALNQLLEPTPQPRPSPEAWLEAVRTHQTEEGYWDWSNTTERTRPPDIQCTVMDLKEVPE